MECSICIQPVNSERDDIVTLDCGHTFHMKCIHMWLNVNNTCPNCRSIVLSSFKCKYVPNPFLPFFGRKDCIFNINDNSILIYFSKNSHIRHHFNFTDIEKIMLVGESIVIRHKPREINGRGKTNNFTYDFLDLRSAMNIFNTLCNKLNQEYMSFRNMLID